MSTALGAVTGSPSSAISAARAKPMRDGTNSDAPPSGTRPMLTNASVKYADSLATTRSPASASDRPAPAAGPFTAVTTGLGISRMAGTIGGYQGNREHVV